MTAPAAANTPVAISEADFPELRQLAGEIDAALRAGDVDFFIERVTGGLTCYAGPKYRRGDLCYGRPTGDLILGVDIPVGDVVFFHTRDQFAEDLRAYFQESRSGLFAWAVRGSAFAAVLGAGAPIGTYTVGSGDSLQSIARREMGVAARWQEILAANPDILGGDPTSLLPGQELMMPDDGHRLYFGRVDGGWRLYSDSGGGCPFNVCDIDDYWELWQGSD